MKYREERNLTSEENLRREGKGEMKKTGSVHCRME